MIYRPLAALLFLCITGSVTGEQTGRYGIGTAPTGEEIKLWDIDISPDGKGLPPGRGSPVSGETVYLEKCQSCHGENGIGGVNDQLVGRFEEGIDYANDASVRRTIGNFWPYATTLYDYIYRSMPHTTPGTLTPDETYSLVAYLLYLNGIITRDKEMNASTLPMVEMPARHLFYWSDEVD